VSEFIIGSMIFLVIALYVWAYWRTQRRKEPGPRHARGAAPRRLTGRTLGGIVKEIVDGWVILEVEPDEPGEPAVLHMRDRGGLTLGDHITIDEYDDGTWEPVVLRGEVDQ
jgi:hypothetical protein